MKKLIWTKEQPVEPGWYWKRRTGKYKKTWRERDEIVYIRNYCGEMCVENWPIPDKDVKWAGPIPKPKKKKEKKGGKNG